MSDRYDSLQKKFTKIKTDLAIIESKKTDIEDKLKKDFNCKTVAAAYKKADKLYEENEKLKNEIKVLLDQAEEILQGEEEEEEL